MLVNKLTNNNSEITSSTFELKSIPNKLYEEELDLNYR